MADKIVQSPSEINADAREYRLTTLQQRLYLAYAAAILVGAGIALKLATDPLSRYFALVVGFLRSLSAWFWCRWRCGPD